MAIKTVYAEITKSERDANGDLVVHGKATSPDLDHDNQICDPVWLKSAMPEWFKFGNIREQHGASAAGVATDMTQDGEAWDITALITDPVAAHKVETKTYKGFSIGINRARVVKDAAAPNGRIVDGRIVEVSLVDRPCNPTALLQLAKAAKPGMTIKSSDFDRERMLVKSQTVVELVEEPVEDVDKDVTVTDEDLLKVIERLEKQAKPKKTAKTKTPKRPVKVKKNVSEPDVVKADEVDRFAELEEKFTKALEASEGRVKTLEAELNKVKSLPVPGGPVLTRTSQEAKVSALKQEQNDKADRYEQLANADGIDRDLRDGYLALAKAARAAV